MAEGLMSIFNIFGGGPGRVTPEELKAMLGSGDAVSLVDVRTREEHRYERIPGSLHIPFEDLSAAVDTHFKGKVVLYCAAGVRSYKASKALSAMGVREVVDLAGGIRAWKSSGGEVEKG